MKAPSAEKACAAGTKDFAVEEGDRSRWPLPDARGSSADKPQTLAALPQGAHCHDGARRSHYRGRDLPTLPAHARRTEDMGARIRKPWNRSPSCAADVAADPPHSM